jgi:IS605 OrfB family transposase
MQLSYVLELLPPTKRKENILLKNVAETQKNREEIVKKLHSGETKLSSAHFKARNLPSAVINQNIREVKSLYKTFKKSDSKKEVPEFKPNQPLCYNNQNYKIDGRYITVPLWTHRTERITFPIKQTPVFRELEYQIIFGAKPGKASLFYKRGRWYFVVTVSFNVEKTTGTNIMGIDIGLRQLAAASVKTPDDKELNRELHTGKEAAYIRKKYRFLRRKLGKTKKIKAIKKISDKEHRWMTDKNHKISRSLVNLAVQEGAGTIVMERLSGIRRRVKSLKRADRNIHSWSFYQLQHFIEYKAHLAGINVVYVDADYTSQICNSCGNLNKSNRKGNLYTCSCGYRTHSDLNAARNIADRYKNKLKQSA